MSKEVRVYVVQTNDCWPLTPLLVQLNDCQSVFRFILIDRDTTGKSLRIYPRIHLQEADRLPPSSSRRKILESYLTEKDWADQTRTFLGACAQASFKQENDLAVAVGAGVYILDDDSVTFQGSREADSYTCIYDYRLLHNPAGSIEASSQAKATDLDAFAAISMLPYERVFGRRYQVRTIENKANRARYLVVNLTHFLATRAFWTTLAREHSGQSCTMETNWGGGDYLAGYYTSGLCEPCMELLHSRLGEPTVSRRFSQFSEAEIIKAVTALCALPDKWDKEVGVSNFLSGRLLPLLSSAIGLGLLTNLLAGYANTPSSPQLQELLKYVADHRIAVEVSAVSATFALLTCLALMVLRLGIP